jgi:hypothetical protein
VKLWVQTPVPPKKKKKKKNNQHECMNGVLVVISSGRSSCLKSHSRSGMETHGPMRGQPNWQFCWEQIIFQQLNSTTSCLESLKNI